MVLLSGILEIYIYVLVDSYGLKHLEQVPTVVGFKNNGKEHFMKNKLLKFLVFTSILTVIAVSQTFKSSSAGFQVRASIGQPFGGTMKSSGMVSKSAMFPRSTAGLKQSGAAGLPNPKNKNKHALSSALDLPTEFALQQAFPNPFNPLTIINYQLPIDNFVTLKVYNTLGQEVAMLVDEMQDAGYKSITFNAHELPSGIYYYRLQAGTFSDMKKVLLIK
ncbi:MAG: T9SS type A sorting domain-containing protein [Bacteroidetes bacterium]|nr:MAG: T9SS type A sorting domain-containing protein [Bacteroidota bacterium]